MVGHNHPSGDPEPSPEDVSVTCDIQAAGKLLSVELLDHIIIGKGGSFVSLKERRQGFVNRRQNGLRYFPRRAAP